MSAAGLLAGTTPAVRTAALLVGNLDITDNVALDIQPLTITQSVDNDVGRLSCVVEGINPNRLQVGTRVSLVMAPGTNQEYALFLGTILMRRKSRRSRVEGLFVSIDCASIEAWLDWRVILKYRNVTQKTGTTITNDDAVVRQILNKSQMNSVITADSINQTQTDLARTNLEGVTAREALERIAERATKYFSAEVNRFFFIDARGKFFWFRGTVGTTAPYRIGDGSYVRRLLDLGSGPVAFWTLREGSGTTVWDSVAGLTGTLTGGYTQDVASGVPNEPGHHALDLNGSTGYVATQSSSTLHPGNTFTVECWLRRDAIGADMAVWSGGTNDLEVGFNSSDQLVIRKEADSTVYTTNSALTDKADWHHVVWTKDGSTRAIYVDGVEWNGSGTNATIVAASGNVNIGRRKSSNDRHFNGRLQMVSLYDAAKSAAVILANYNQGMTITPEDWEEEDDGSDVVHRVYIKGDNKAGSGWVDSGEEWSFGKVQAIIEDTDSTTWDDRRRIGWGYLRWHQLKTGGEFTVTGFDGWRLGQTLTFADTVMNDGSEQTFEVQRITTDVGLGSGVLTHRIRYGASPPSQYRSFGRRFNRRGGR